MMGSKRKYSSACLKGLTLERTPLLERTQILILKYKHVMLPLIKRPLSNKDRIFWQKGSPYHFRTTVLILRITFITFINDILQ